MDELEEGEIVFCTVEKIVGTIVFVKIQDHDLSGTIVFSEISPGRIRNIRDYVIPGKRILCKVLKVGKNEVYLSLRRVKMKEKQEFNELHKKEKSYSAILKTLLKEEAKEIIEKIKEKEGSLVEFLNESVKNIKKFETYFGKEVTKQITEILKEKKHKKTTLKRKFFISSKSPEGMLKIKKIIKDSLTHSKCDQGEISYLGAGNYVIKIKTIDPKKSDSQLDDLIEYLEENSKKEQMSFLIKTNN